MGHTRPAPGMDITTAPAETGDEAEEENGGEWVRRASIEWDRGGGMGELQGGEPRRTTKTTKTQNATPTTMPLGGGITTTYDYFWYD